MTTILQQRNTTRTGDLARRVSLAAARLFAGLAAELSRQAINRRVLRKLSVMTDRELKDIGLIRQDVMDAGAGEAGRLPVPAGPPGREKGSTPRPTR